MTSNITAYNRRALPQPLEPCICSAKCKMDRKLAEDLSYRSQFNLNPNPLVRDSRFFVGGELLIPTSSKNQKPSYKRSTKTSILDLPDETLLKIFQSANDIVNVICLALSCKRLCRVYQHFVDKKDRRQENFLWHNVSGNWKQQLVPLLAKGWIPKDRIRVCWGCWRFVEYGPESRRLWIKHLTKKGCRYALASGYRQVWLENWEIKTWLGEVVESTDGNIVSAKDMRIRCPICVVRGSTIKLLMWNSEVRRRMPWTRLDDLRVQEFGIILDDTRPKRYWRVSR